MKNPRNLFLIRKPWTLIVYPFVVKYKGWSGKVCMGLGGNKVASKSVAHFTHSDDDKHHPHRVAETDLDGNSRPLFAKPYDKPHETTSESYNPEADKEKTLKLQGYLKQITNDEK